MSSCDKRATTIYEFVDEDVDTAMNSSHYQHAYVLGACASKCIEVLGARLCRERRELGRKKPSFSRKGVGIGAYS